MNFNRVKAYSTHRSGRMNGIESAYAAYLDDLIKIGEVSKYYFEEINLRIGDKCFYKCDYMVINAQYEVEFHEVKGFWEDDALVKIKAVADKFPFQFFGITREKGKWIKRDFTVK